MDLRLCFIVLTMTVLILTVPLSIFLIHIEQVAPEAESIKTTAHDIETNLHRSNRTVHRIKTTPYSFNTLNVSSRYLENYLLQLENARLKHTHSNHSQFIYSCNPSNVQVAEARNPKYFNILRNSTFVQTVFLRLSMNSIFEYMIKQYFGFGSNNCSMMGVTYTKKIYGAACEENITEVLKSHPLQKQALDVGLPRRYKNEKSYQHHRNLTVTFIHLIQNAIVASDGDIYVGNFHVVPDGCKRNTRAECFKSALMTNVPEYDEVFVISQYWGGAFYHNTLENLPRLAPYLTFLQKYPHIKIHVKADTRFMSFTKIAKSRLIYGTMKAKLLYVPPGTPCGVSPLFSVQTLSRVLRENLQLTHIQNTNVVVLIKRRTKRYFNNHDSILKMLQTHASAFNMVVKVFADDPVPGIEKTVSMFSQAAIVVAPHGAGESNLIFSKPGTILIEGLCLDHMKFNQCYRNMALSLGLVYHGLVFSKNCFDITADDVEKPYTHYLNHVSHL